MDIFSILDFFLNLIVTAARRYSPWQRTSNGHNFLKNDPNWANEVVSDIYRKSKCQKHLIWQIWIIFEKVITILKFAAKFFTSYRRAADILQDFFLSFISEISDFLSFFCLQNIFLSFFLSNLLLYLLLSLFLSVIFLIFLLCFLFNFLIFYKFLSLQGKKINVTHISFFFEYNSPKCKFHTTFL